MIMTVIIIMMVCITTFQTKFGNVLAGDTDSVFVCHKLEPDVASVTVDAVAEASRLTIALADSVNALMKAPKKLEFEKVYGTMLLLSKKRYGGLLYAPNHEWGKDPPIDIKGLQSQRRDGCPLVRDIVRDCLTSILHSGSSEDAGALVRQRLVQLMDDTLPLETYAIQKTLRKSMQDVCHPMSADEVSIIRNKIQIAGGHPDTRGGGQLTYAEQDDAIRLKIPLPWRLRIRLPHVMLAYRMREKDVGAAPVSGDIIRYIVTNNGRGNKIWEKVESLEAVRAQSIAVDRKYYLKSLQTPLMALFLPIVKQQRQKHSSSPTIIIDDKACIADTANLLFDITKRRPWKHDAALRAACMSNSPLVMAFAKQQRRLDDNNDASGASSSPNPKKPKK